MHELIARIREIAKDLPETKIMEVCGGHTNTIMRYGIRDLLPENIKLVAGPGCPVCVTSQKDIDSVIHMALNGVKITTYGDMLHVPGTSMNLDDARSKGADIKMILSATDALKHKDHVFFGIGFETTTPMTAFLLKKGIKVFSTHKTMPPPMMFLVNNDSDLKGFIDPGHVSAIIGTKLWESLPIPQVIAGFRPDQMLSAIYKLLKLIKENKNHVINDYEEVVRPEGNIKAQQMINDQMIEDDADWRGLGTIPQSGLIPKNPEQDARLIYEDLIKDIRSEDNPACRCSEIIRGLIEPNQCPLFGTACTPEKPKGACMVSQNEGACAIFHRFQKHDQ